MFRFTCGERFKKIKKSQILYQDCLQNVIFLFMSLESFSIANLDLKEKIGNVVIK